MLAFYSVSIFFGPSWLSLAGFAILFAALCAILKPSAKAMLKLGFVVYFICLLTVFFNMFPYADGSVSFSWNGLLRGCFFAGRILLLVWASLAVCLSMDSHRLTCAFRSILSPLSRLRVPVEDISTVLSIAVRFIPLTAEEYFSIRDAQWARGAKFDEGPVLARIGSHCSILVPLVINLFRKADRLAFSMDSRGYGRMGVKRTDIWARRLDGRSAAACILFSMACVACAILP